MKVTTLASGSSGNAIFLGHEDTGILIDCGLTGKKTTEALQAIEVKPEKLAGIVVTHEHLDHIQGVGVMSRKYDLPVYATEKTWGALNSAQLGKIAAKNQQYLAAGQGAEIGGLKLEIFNTSHDAADPIGLAAFAGEQKIGVATDTGCVTAGMDKHLQNCHVLLIEANHDEEMLVAGSYPDHLKKRIKGQLGHLSNKTTGSAVTKWVGGETQQVILAHLSKENNLPYLARKTVEDLLTEAGIHVGLELQVTVAPREESHPLVEVVLEPAWKNNSQQAG